MPVCSLLYLKGPPADGLAGRSLGAEQLSGGELPPGVLRQVGEEIILVKRVAVTRQAAPFQGDLVQRQVRLSVLDQVGAHAGVQLPGKLEGVNRIGGAQRLTIRPLQAGTKRSEE